MPYKKILEIDVDSSQFAEFYKMFQQYQADVENMPDEWKAYGESATEAHEAIAAVAGALTENLSSASTHAKDLVDHLRDASDAQKSFAAASTDGEISLKKMGKEAKEFADTIFGIGKFLLKIGVLGIGTVAGGLFGFDKLAESSVGTQRQARGLGLTTGQLRAFQTDFGDRYIDEGTLGSVADARNDLTKRVWLQRATGYSSSQIDQADVGSLAGQLALRAHDWWSSTPASEHNAQFLQTTGLTQSGLSLDQVRQFGNTDRVELTRALSQYQVDSKNLNVSDRNTDSLYAFMRDLRLAGSDIETYFSNKLAVLGPHLGDFITTLEGDAKVLLDEVLTPENLKKAEVAIEDFTHYLGSDEFKQGAKDFCEGLKEMGVGLAELAKFTASLFPDASPEKSVPAGKTTDSSGNVIPADAAVPNNHYWDNPINGSPKSKLFHPYNYITDGSLFGFPNVTNDYQGAGFENINPANPDARKNLALFKSLEAQNGLPSGVLGALGYVESRGNPYAVSPTGAQGLMQLLKSTQHDMGVTDGFDFNQSARGGAKDLGMLLKRYSGHGDDSLKMAIAAYHDGPTGFDREIKGHEQDWMSRVSPAGQREVADVLKQMAKYRQANVNITVTNKTGSDVAISTNAGAN